MQFLVDESTGKRFAALLAATGHDVIFAGDAMPSASDEEVLAKAEKEDRILISDDKDFGELVVRLRKPSTGVILLRMASVDAKTRTGVVAEIVKERDIVGKLVIVKEGRVRIRQF
ncbi:DUF5615 family PIN-like protein [Candidatus Woesearchaeota archaeon]|nr:DUF5615 family PIN-like protein [Candidatus Woesearchaeota archaeon]